MNRYRKALYLEIAEEIKKRIKEGLLLPGSQLPAEVEFANELGISRGTLREALSMLEKEGLVTRIHGVGSFVTGDKPRVVAEAENLESLSKIIRKSGFLVETKVIDIKKDKLTNDECQKLRVNQQSNGFVCQSIYSANRIPIVYVKEILPTWLIKEDSLLKARYMCSDILDFIQKFVGLKPKELVSSITFVLPDLEVVENLNVDYSIPVIRNESILLDDQSRPLMLSLEYLLANELEIKIKKAL